MIAKDHNGREFPTVQEMCAHYGIKVNTYRWRLAQGHSLEKALTVPPARRGFTLDGSRNYLCIKGGGSLACRDHNGKHYESFSAMCRSWGVTQIMVRKRMQRGYNLRDALTIPPMVSGRPRVDYSKIETRRHHINRVVKLDSPDIKLITRAWI